MPIPLRPCLPALVLAASTLPALAAESVRIDDRFNAAAMAPAMFKAQSDGNKTVRGIRRVAIGSFDIEFATKGSSSASATWISQPGFNNERANPGISMAMSGVRDADMQAIVDQVHAGFVRELRAGGLEVIPFDQVRQTGAFRKLAASGKPAPHRKSGGPEAATVVSAEGRPVAGASLVTRGGASSALSGFSAIASGLLSGPELAAETDAAVINVRMVLRFVEMANGNSSLFSRVSGAATAESKLSPTVVAGDTKVHIFTAHGGGAFTLQSPLQMDSAAFTGVKDLMTPGSKATGVGLAVLSFAMGRNDANPISQFEAVADPQRYRDLVGHGLGQVGSMMVEQIKTLR